MTQAQFFSRCLARHLCASGKEGNRAWPSPRRSLQWISASVIVVSSLVLASCKGLAILKDYKEDNCRIINHALLCSGSDTQLNFAVYFYTSLGFIDPASN
ncbi:MAG TPA: hypothetical protein VEN79_06430, partial [Terriglobia bacterium]|nr:hypothetical protein [Terriglobia bacterium]